MFNKIKNMVSVWMLKRIIYKYSSGYNTAMSFNEATELSEQLQREKGYNPNTWVVLNVKIANKLSKWANRLNIEVVTGIWEDWFNQPHIPHVSYGFTPGMMLFTNTSNYSHVLSHNLPVSKTPLGLFVPLWVYDTGIGEYRSPLEPITFNAKNFKFTSRNGPQY